MSENNPHISGMYTIIASIIGIAGMYGGILLKNSFSVESEIKQNKIDNKVNYQERIEKKVEKPNQEVTRENKPIVNNSKSSTNTEAKTTIIIEDIKRNVRDTYLENFIKNILNTLKINYSKIEGNKTVNYEPNKNVLGEYRATMYLNLSIDDKVLSLTLYGRAQNKNDEITILSHNKELIKNEIKQTHGI